MILGYRLEVTKCDFKQKDNRKIHEVAICDFMKREGEFLWKNEPIS